MSFSARITALLETVAAFRAPNVFNPWADFDRTNDIDEAAPLRRRSRLLNHFRCEPELLLIGEAPGYQGCRFSGVPFTSERLLLDGAVPRVNLVERITKLPRPLAEPSATIVWRTLYELGVADRAVLWNAFAFHPHQPDSPMSNRTPTPAELLRNSVILRDVVCAFPDAQVVAVGRAAQGMLTRLAFRHWNVRHPSMGGAKAFREGLEEVLRSIASRSRETA